MSVKINFNDYQNKLQIELLKDFKRFYQEAFTAVATDTPVDTGRAQSSWWLAQPGQDVRPKDGFGVPRPPSLYWLTWQNSEPVLINPNDYVVYLNEGHSQQAPSKFIERAINRAVRNFK